MPETTPQDDGSREYDLLLPPGIPGKVIERVIEEYGDRVKLTERTHIPIIGLPEVTQKVSVFRGPYEAVHEIYSFIQEELQKWIEGTTRPGRVST